MFELPPEKTFLLEFIQTSKDTKWEITNPVACFILQFPTHLRGFVGLYNLPPKTNFSQNYLTNSNQHSLSPVEFPIYLSSLAADWGFWTTNQADLYLEKIEWVKIQMNIIAPPDGYYLQLSEQFKSQNEKEANQYTAVRAQCSFQCLSFSAAGSTNDQTQWVKSSTISVLLRFQQHK